MGPINRILLLAGSSEARLIASELLGHGIRVQAVMSEPPRGATPMPVPFEVIDDVTSHDLTPHLLRAMAGVDAVIDASHGFDGSMTKRGAEVAAQLDVPFLSFARPPWDPGEHPLWCRAPDVARAMAFVGPEARVFSATGWASLPEYAGFPGACLMLRQTSPHGRKPPFDFVELVFGDPPFSVDSEVALFEQLRVDVLICRNLGGQPSRPKLEAAKRLNLRVILIDRPELPPGVNTVASLREVMAWLGLAEK